MTKGAENKMYAYEAADLNEDQRAEMKIGGVFEDLGGVVIQGAEYEELEREDGKREVVRRYPARIEIEGRPSALEELPWSASELASIHERMMIATSPTRKIEIVGPNGQIVPVEGVYQQGETQVEISRYVQMEEYHAGEEDHLHYKPAREFLIKEWLTAQVRNLKKAGIENPVILEVGGGTGLYSGPIAEAFPECIYIAAEKDRVAYEFMMRRKREEFSIINGVVPVTMLPENVHPIHADGINVSLPETGVHIIIMAHTFHHHDHIVKDLGMERYRESMELAKQMHPGCNPAMYIIDECHSGEGNLPKKMEDVPRRIGEMHMPYISDMITKEGILGRGQIDEDVIRVLMERGDIKASPDELPVIETVKNIAHARIQGLLASEKAAQQEGQRVIRELIRLIRFVKGHLPDKYYRPWEIRELAVEARQRSFKFGPMGEAKISRQELGELVRNHGMRRSQSKAFIERSNDNETNQAGIHMLEIRPQS